MVCTSIGRRDAAAAESISFPSTSSVELSSSRSCAWAGAAVSFGREVPRTTTEGVVGGVGTAVRIGPVVRPTTGTIPPDSPGAPFPRAP